MTLAEAMALVHTDPRKAPAEAWRAIRCAAVAQSLGDEREDYVQAALIALLRTVERGVVIEQPSAWLRTVIRNRRIDMWHAWRRRHVADGDVDRYPGEPMDDDASEARTRLAAMLDAISAGIDRHHEHRGKMRATLLRALGRSYSEIRVALEIGGTDALLAKHIERGREPLLSVLDGLELRADYADAIASLRELVARRRCDAGQARPARRAMAA
jgi:DNA-directed RNA polymerase specialized sigma24 family protein